MAHPLLRLIHRWLKRPADDEVVGRHRREVGDAVRHQHGAPERVKERRGRHGHRHQMVWGDGERYCLICGELAIDQNERSGDDVDDG